MKQLGSHITYSISENMIVMSIETFFYEKKTLFKKNVTSSLEIEKNVYNVTAWLYQMQNLRIEETVLLQCFGYISVPAIL